MSRSRYRGLVVLLMDVCLIFFFNFAMFFSYLTDGNIQLYNLVMHIGLLTVCVLVFQLWFKTYDTLWRYAESQEYLTLLKGMGCGFLLYSAVNIILGTSFIWISEALKGTALALIAMLAIRFLYRKYRRRVTSIGAGAQRYTAIIGAGSAGVALLGELNDNVYGTYKPYCLIDDSREKQRKRIHGVSVIGPIDNTVELLANTPVTDIILAINNTTTERKREILDICANTRCRVHILGDPVTQVEGDASGKKSLSSGMREVQIEDLLGREPIKLDNQRVNEFVRGKVVLVTGGGGSIGAELCRQIAAQGPKRLIILDIAENTTYELQNDLVHLYGRDFPLSVEIASVRDKARMEQIFAKYRPQLVLHAAAHKHVPLMEDCPGEAIKNNVFGTYNAACTAREFGAEKFVLISTDKAVNPTNVMGCTKRLAEIYVQSLGLSIEQGRTPGKTRFVTTRFGNVLGSNGSVIPRFRDQISKGGPVTVTHPDITRFFMTIPEACRLVMEAATMSTGNQIFVFDMGESVKIAHLARRMISLAGFEPEKDIRIEYTGLRPGEKLYEEVLSNKENTLPTTHDRIRIAKVREYDYGEACGVAEELETLSRKVEIPDMIRLMKRTVPEFKSKNSRFEVYDK